MIYLVSTSNLKRKEIVYLESHFKDSSIIPTQNYFSSYPTLFLFLFKKPVGFLTYLEILDEIQILNFGIKKFFRRKGFGRLFLKIFLYNFKNRDIFLEVLKNNIPAIKLYEALGFKIIGERKNFYKGMDAYVMMKKGEKE